MPDWTSWGEYVSFIDSDDYISSDLYEKNIEILQKDKTIDILQFPMVFVEGERQTPAEFPEFVPGTHMCDKKDFFQFWGSGGTGVRGFVWQNIYRKELWDGLRFERMYFEDCEIQSRLLEKVHHVYVSGHGAYYYVQREGSILHSRGSAQKSQDDFRSTIPFIERMAAHGVERALVVKCYLLTANRLLDKSYLFTAAPFKASYARLNRIGVSVGEILAYKGLPKHKIKVLFCRLIGLDNFNRLQAAITKITGRHVTA
ncbi:hypothetical protein [uncultured Brachyspira sp.]|uniref:hypothetical protein n=1 Tax=uncultured Brachyspira sp. TaxID=221953 RepID=UPI00261D96FE|nr:hypothetical protein [uncultured Brachyspira sp.]